MTWRDRTDSAVHYWGPRGYVYLAGPITGLTFDSAADWREGLSQVLNRMGYGVLNPMRGKEKFRIPGRLTSTFDEGAAAVERDLYDIRRAEVVLLNLSGAVSVSLGTMAEMGYARAMEKHIVVVGPEGPHNHVFVHEMASVIVPDLAAALNILEVL